jgi:hypothetical protein
VPELSRHDRVEDGESGRASHIADHMMQLEIHLVQRFLHVLHVVARQFNQVISYRQFSPFPSLFRSYLRGMWCTEFARRKR